MILDKYAKNVAIVATQPFNDKPWGLICEYAIRLSHVVIMLSLWRTVMPEEGTVSGMSRAAVLTYALVGSVFGTQLYARLWIDNDIWSGRIANRMLRPLGLYGQFLSEMVGKWVPDLLLFSLPLFLAAPLLGVDPLPASASAGMWFAFSLVCAVAVGTALDLFFAACMVYLEHSVYALSRIRTALTTLLSGRLVPLALLPWGLGDYLQWLPFASLVSAPLRIYTGTGDPQKLVALQLAWAALLWGGAHAVWRHTRERMVSHGG